LFSEIDTIISHNLQVKKLRHRKAKWFSYCHAVSSRNRVYTRSLVPEPACSVTLLCSLPQGQVVWTWWRKGLPPGTVLQ
jgi:hypothetical protein